MVPAFNPELSEIKSNHFLRGSAEYAHFLNGIVEHLLSTLPLSEVFMHWFVTLPPSSFLLGWEMIRKNIYFSYQ